MTHALNRTKSLPTRQQQNHSPSPRLDRRLLLTGAVATAAVSLSGCASQNIDAYSGEKPVLDLQQYFNGVLDAYGVFTDRSGAVVKRFTVVMRCTWAGNEGELDEDFTYSDGTKQKRIWRLTKLAGGRYTGTAGDVVGTAQGQARGNAFYWTYTLALPVGGKPNSPSGDNTAVNEGATIINVTLDDWMYLMTDKVMLNKATMRKLGVTLGEVTLSFTKR
jgi:Protein of unknown function (DUF3833)